jgi:hypothetical protein
VAIVRFCYNRLCLHFNYDSHYSPHRCPCRVCGNSSTDLDRKPFGHGYLSRRRVSPRGHQLTPCCSRAAATPVILVARSLALLCSGGEQGILSEKIAHPKPSQRC